MIPEARREKILLELNTNNICTIDSLIKLLKVSKVTIQRDINILKKNGQVEKIHGGVKLRKNSETIIQTRFITRLNQNYQKKLNVAKKAIEFVEDGDTIFIDSSTTCYIFALELLKKRFSDLNLVTTSPSIICESSKLSDIVNLKLISTGGSYRQDYNMFYGEWANHFLKKINIDSAFISAAGISVDSKIITSSDIELTNTLRVIFKKSKEINLLVDDSKFFKTGIIKIDDLNNCKRVITNIGVSDMIIKRFKEKDMPELIF